MASTASPQPQTSWLVYTFTYKAPLTYPHFTSVIFKSDGLEALGVLSTAASNPCPKLDSQAAPVRPTIVLLDKNDLLVSLFFILVYQSLIHKKIMGPVFTKSGF